MFMCMRTAIVLSLLTGSMAPSVQTPAATARIEGVVLQAGAVVPQPIVGARVTVTRVNGATGGNLPFRGEARLEAIGVNAIFPGMPTGQPAPSLILPAAPPQTTFVLPIPSVSTGRDGRFVVPDLEEGTYRLSITRPGYVRQEFGQRAFPGQGTLINVASGQVVRDIRINLTPTGNLSGRLVDEAGQPAVG